MTDTTITLLSSSAAVADSEPAEEGPKMIKEKQETSHTTTTSKSDDTIAEDKPVEDPPIGEDTEAKMGHTKENSSHGKLLASLRRSISIARDNIAVSKTEKVVEKSESSCEASANGSENSQQTPSPPADKKEKALDRFVHRILRTSEAADKDTVKGYTAEQTQPQCPNGPSSVADEVMKKAEAAVTEPGDKPAESGDDTGKKKIPILGVINKVFHEYKPFNGSPSSSPVQAECKPGSTPKDVISPVPTEKKVEKEEEKGENSKEGLRPAMIDALRRLTKHSDNKDIRSEKEAKQTVAAKDVVRGESQDRSTKVTNAEEQVKPEKHTQKLITGLKSMIREIVGKNGEKNESESMQQEKQNTDLVCTYKVGTQQKNAVNLEMKDDSEKEEVANDCNTSGEEIASPSSPKWKNRMSHLFAKAVTPKKPTTVEGGEAMPAAANTSDIAPKLHYPVLEQEHESQRGGKLIEVKKEEEAQSS